MDIKNDNNHQMKRMFVTALFIYKKHHYKSLIMKHTLKIKSNTESLGDVVYTCFISVLVFQYSSCKFNTSSSDLCLSISFLILKWCNSLSYLMVCLIWSFKCLSTSSECLKWKDPLNKTILIIILQWFLHEQ